MVGGLLEHGCADIGSYDAIEPSGKRERGLSVSRRAVPGQVVPGDLCIQVVEQPFRVAGPMGGVCRGMPGEMVGWRPHFARVTRWARRTPTVSATGSASTVPPRELTVVAANIEL